MGDEKKEVPDMTFEERYNHNRKFHEDMKTKKANDAKWFLGENKAKEKEHGK